MTGKNERQRWPALDGLRALAVIAVMLFHAHGPALPGGFLGVDVFFVLSGFLITTQLHGEYRQSGRIRIGAFFLRRAARLQPALLAMLLFVAVLNLVGANPFSAQPWWAEIVVVLLGMANWTRAFNWHAPEMLGHTWSLAVEEQFYLVWVFVWVALQKLRLTDRQQVRAVLFLTLISAGAMSTLHLHGASVERLYNGTDMRIGALLTGCALAMYRAMFARGASGLFGDDAHHWTAALALLSLALLTLAAFTINWTAPAMYQGGYLLLAILSAMVIPALIAPQPGWLARMLSMGLLQRVGVLSYGLYLWHFPLYCLALQAAQGQSILSLVMYLTGATLLTWLLAEASHRWLEMPLRQWVRNSISITEVKLKSAPVVLGQAAVE